MDAAPSSSAATAKRKRTAGADIAAQAVEEEVSDAEVEEFYAILRRMRDASRLYVTGTGAGAGARAPAPRAPAWCPSFSWEDFAPPPAAAPAPAVAAPPRPQPVAENARPQRRPAGVCLDLNAEPEPEAPATPRTERVSA